MTGGTVTTSGSTSRGLFASGADADFTATGVSFMMAGQESHGAFAQSGARIALNGVTISTTGENAAGATARLGASLTMSGGSLLTTGIGAHGVDVESGSAVTAAGLRVTATGPDASALFMTGPAGTLQTANVSESKLTSAAAPAIKVLGGAANVQLAGAVVTGNGIWLSVADGTAPGLLGLNADSSILRGAALTTGTSTSNIVLQNGTVWNLTGDSNVTNLTNRESSILFSPPVGGVFKALTTANYVGASGTQHVPWQRRFTLRQAHHQRRQRDRQLVLVHHQRRRSWR
ncbi:hypothetical protein [Bradyrhizobium retamae]|uniref:Autochaperone domain-containing protein n=1 Tax=Bradyrhizobium retamae TaxID=1300035 RepID=A0A0R3MCX5_9BRAD|nr:hypothetical protein [Bradyrhizobium retamae]KRR17724.1 hypothetical protein CQ13_35885 [Bradyrhizobium retamae]